jgi:hypothetical protein
MRANLLLVLAFFVALFFHASSGTANEAKDILHKADQSRGNLSGITWTVVLENPGTASEIMSFDVKARGFDILAESLAPPKDRGNRILMVNGNMWFHKPGLSKAVPISQRQRLMGNAAYGDIAATNYADDYAATSLEEESINGELCHVFDLKAKENHAAYDRIKYWISKRRVVGVKAEYFTVSGKKFKSATMESANTIKVDGEGRPFISKIIIYDDLLTTKVTTLSLTKPMFRKLGSYVFDVNLLVK